MWASPWAAGVALCLEQHRIGRQSFVVRRILLRIAASFLPWVAVAPHDGRSPGFAHGVLIRVLPVQPATQFMVRHAARTRDMLRRAGEHCHGLPHPAPTVQQRAAPATCGDKDGRGTAAISDAECGAGYADGTSKSAVACVVATCDASGAAEC